MRRMELVFLLEEKSAKAMLEGLLPRIASTHHVRYIVFEGRQDLQKQLERKIRTYNQDANFIVLHDQDAHNCKDLKSKLLALCRKTGRKSCGIIVRIACHELESFYLGDLAAVEKALGIAGLGKMQNKKKYRTPDDLGNPSQELKILTQKHYQKISGSKAIGTLLDLKNNRSRSFHHLISAIKRLT